MKLAVLFLLMMSAAPGAFAQSPDSLQRAAMNRLDWWVGRWTGEAWVSMGPGRQDTTVMVETIRKDVGGTIVLVEGLGRRKQPHMREGDVVHHAFAVVSYDDKKQAYRWQSWRVPGGLYNEVEPTITERGFQWSMDTGRGRIRYTARLNDQGQWDEVGEYSVDGVAWRPFFGMLLNRVR